MDVNENNATAMAKKRRGSLEAQLTVGAEKDGMVDDMTRELEPKGKKGKKGKKNKRKLQGRGPLKQLDNARYMNANADITAGEAHSPAGAHGHDQEPTTPRILSSPRINLRVRAAPSPPSPPPSFCSPPNSSYYPPPRFPPPEVYAAVQSQNAQKVKSLQSQIATLQTQISFLEAAQKTSTPVDHTILTPKRHECFSTELFEEQRDEYIKKLWDLAPGDGNILRRDDQLREIKAVEREVLRGYGGATSPEPGTEQAQAQFVKMRGGCPQFGSIEGRLHGCDLR